MIFLNRWNCHATKNVFESFIIVLRGGRNIEKALSLSPQRTRRIRQRKRSSFIIQHISVFLLHIYEYHLIQQARKPRLPLGRLISSPEWNQTHTHELILYIPSYIYLYLLASNCAQLCNGLFPIFSMYRYISWTTDTWLAF